MGFVSGGRRRGVLRSAAARFVPHRSRQLTMYAKLHRIAIRAAVCLSALGGVSVANAGYAWPADPAGFVRSGPWGNGYGYAAGANDSTFGKIIHQQNGLKVNVAGRPVTMPVSYRFAQNAPRFAAAVIFAHPALRTAAGVAAMLGAANIFWDEAEKVWKGYNKSIQEIVPEYEYTVAVHPFNQNKFQSAEDACIAYFGSIGGRFLSTHSNRCFGYDKTGYPFDQPLSKTKIPCPAGWTSTPAGCLSPESQEQVRIQDKEDFVTRIINPDNNPGWPMPDTVPFELPYPTPLPVEPSPGPWVNPEPGTNPKHRPLFVPTGDPVPNPNYDPNAQPSPENQPWIQPGVRLNPSPAVNDPFRIDVKPVDRPKPNETPMPGPEPEVDPNANPNDKPKPDERPGLCDEYPDILACAKPELDTPEDEILKTSKDVSYTPDNLFGGGSCPANKTMSIGGQEMTVWDWDASCGYIQNYMRPVVLVLCAFAAFVIVSGGTRQ